MTLNVSSALTGGIRRVANRNGLLMVVVYAVVGFAWQLTFNSVFARLLADAGYAASTGVLTVDAPMSLLVAGAVVSFLALTYVSVLAFRVFVGGHTRSIPGEYYTHDVASAVVNSILGGLAYGLLVLVGSILLVVPGLVAYVAFFFTMPYVAVEDENFLAALRDSWHLTRGHWLRLFALVLIVFVGFGVLVGVVSFVAIFGVTAVAGQTAASVVSALIYLPLSIVTVGIVSEAFTQLRAEPTDGAN